MRNFFIIGAALLFVSSCGSKDPLSGLSESDKLFLFGDDESKITFMGWPNNGTKASCNPNSMGQGYAFIMDGNSIFIESIRPNGVEKHKINKISASDGFIEIKAKNGANLPFTLKFSEIGESATFISFDGEANSQFVRCIR